MNVQEAMGLWTQEIERIYLGWQEFMRRWARRQEYAYPGAADWEIVADDALIVASCVYVTAPRESADFAPLLRRVRVQMAMNALKYSRSRRHPDRRAVPIPGVLPAPGRANEPAPATLDLGCLGENYRYVVTRCVIRGDSPADVARDMGCSRSTVRSRVRWAMAKLRRELDPAKLRTMAGDD